MPPGRLNPDRSLPRCRSGRGHERGPSAVSLFRQNTGVGVPGRIRTRDMLLRRQPLYPLSYWDTVYRKCSKAVRRRSTALEEHFRRSTEGPSWEGTALNLDPCSSCRACLGSPLLLVDGPCRDAMDCAAAHLDTHDPGYLESLGVGQGGEAPLQGVPQGPSRP